MISQNIATNAGKNLLTDTFSFENFIKYNGLYVDKTEYLYRLITSGKRLYFFSRPRRFGKSLTLSTLKAIFQGKKELFKDLFIYDQPYDWKEYPVIHLDMGSVSSSISDELNKDLIYLVKNQAKINNIELSEDNARRCFIELINKLYERDGKVVILIDEYDKPILNNIEKPNLSQLQEIMNLRALRTICFYNWRRQILKS